MNDHVPSLDAIKRYYGEVLKSSADLQTSACCIDGAPAPHIRTALDHVHDEVKARFYGCGSPIPFALGGTKVLDLGCGAGRDCYVLSQLVEPDGSVIGVDMTEAQLEVARRHLGFHREKLGYANVDFRKGYIEDLRTADIADASMDVVVSNCVLNLSPDKPRVFREIFRVLKPGGELYFSDVFADRRIPADLAADPVLRGECLGGALYWEDFRRLLASIGCADARVMERRRLAINNPDIESRTGAIVFCSVTVRAFKLDLEDRCEDYGQAAIYRGTVAEAPHAFMLDDHHRFETGKAMTVCGNTADMLSQTRFAPHFEIVGGKSVHYGLFDCGPSIGNGDELPANCC
ncbi:MAG: methyltransferase domain-containing protein [Alphaproteobacteria bacterium]|nr:methyltransferase domain-containing protein [Alphaproteobacteria bacterium]MBU6474036.1 methyltransferase domain-containing protein [Alphaproteobacteria bacterium]MDE2013021.1 methyltransferase domain-containing protein [Alphaproteobacteria bacterium]MDE2072414.1 methyltransferase domain-containing protein [Alphaproteobacteria bacterium]